MVGSMNEASMDKTIKSGGRGVEKRKSVGLVSFVSSNKKRIQKNQSVANIGKDLIKNVEAIES